ncbi:inorganic pyrophosphatase 2 [Canna indica]|uniref:Inorganic pyrophosphatase 2 n=1 Tax=Canna indica TaxID=4628 RepID=A0AAQ3QG83_9LILI|nr:inorganic pyrophosphatase 2 [Canna indica]
MSWDSAMETIMWELHAQGRTITEIAKTLKTAPLPANTIAAIRSAYVLGCELRIVSDANRFFIETILKHHGLMGYFSESTPTQALSMRRGSLEFCLTMTSVLLPTDAISALQTCAR